MWTWYLAWKFKVDIFAIFVNTIEKVKSYVIHPDYGIGRYQNDICLLTLDIPLKFNENVNKIPLDTFGAKVGTNCTISGWGDQVDHGGNYPVDLQWTKVMIKSEKECFNSYGTVFDAKTMMCAFAPVR